MTKKPLTVFKETIKRSRDFCDLYEAGTTLPESEDLVRSAIVMTVAGFDAYFTDKFSSILVPYLKSHKPGPTLIKVLEEAGLNAEAALEIAIMQRPFRRIRKLVENHISERTTQRFNAIDELFLSIGIRDLCKNAEKKTGYSALNGRVEAFVLKRHAIVHRADLNSHAKPQKTDVKKIRRRIDDVEKLVIACDEIIDSATKKRKKKK